MLEWPVDNPRITQPYGYDPNYPSKSHFHYGTDFGELVGVPAFTVCDGVIDRADNNGGYGWCVQYTGWVDPYGWLHFIYGHGLEGSFLVKPGQKVHTHTPVFKIDTSGYAFGSHLHFGVYSAVYGWLDPVQVITKGDEMRPEDHAKLDAAYAQSQANTAAIAGMADEVEWVSQNRPFLQPVAFMARDAGITSTLDTANPSDSVSRAIRRGTALLYELGQPVADVQGRTTQRLVTNLANTEVPGQKLNPNDGADKPQGTDGALD